MIETLILIWSFKINLTFIWLNFEKYSSFFVINRNTIIIIFHK